jgi:hypothetical protein
VAGTYTQPLNGLYLTGMFGAVLPKFDTFKLADTVKLVDTTRLANLANVANTVKLVDTFKLADTLADTVKLVDTLADTVKLVDTTRLADLAHVANTVKLIEMFRLADTVRLFDAALPKFDTAELARDVEIAARRLESDLQQQLYAGGLDVDVVTWWTCLPPSSRMNTIMTFVWILVLGRLATWSADYPDISKYIQDHTGITPVAVATAAAWAARAGYKWCSSN